MRRLVRSGIVAAMLATGACTGWRQVAVSPTALPGEPQEVRVTRPDGTRLTLTNAQIVNDSIVGSSDGQRLALPLSDVRRMAVPATSSSKRAAGLTVLGGALAALALWAIVVAGGS